MDSLNLSLESKTQKGSSQTSSLFYVRAAVVRATGNIDPFVFLMNIDASNGEDTFERVCSLTDVITYSSTRSEAIARGDSLYRVSNASIFFDTPSEVVSAIEAIDDAVNLLVREHNEYTYGSTQILSVSREVTGVDSTLLEESIASYQDALQSIEADESAIKEMQASIDFMDEQLKTQQKRVQNITAAYTTVYSYTETKATTHRDNYNAVLLFSALTAGELTQATTYRNNAVTDLAAVATSLASLKKQVDDEKQLLTTLFDDLAVSSKKMARSSAALDEKRAAADRLLATILTLDPSYSG